MINNIMMDRTYHFKDTKISDIDQLLIRQIVRSPKIDSHKSQDDSFIGRKVLYQEWLGVNSLQIPVVGVIRDLVPCANITLKPISRMLTLCGLGSHGSWSFAPGCGWVIATAVTVIMNRTNRIYPYAIAR